MAEWLRRLTRNQMGSSRVGSNPTRSADLFAILILLVDTKLSALSGNRTPVSRVAGENSTTEPTMRAVSRESILSTWISIQNDDKKSCIVGESNPGLPRGRREFYH